MEEEEESVSNKKIESYAVVPESIFLKNYSVHSYYYYYDDARLIYYFSSLNISHNKKQRFSPEKR